MQEAVEIKMKVQWRAQKAGDARNMEYQPRDTVGCEEHQLKRDAQWAARSQGWVAQVLWNSHLTTMCHGCWVGAAGHNVCPVGF